MTETCVWLAPQRFNRLLTRDAIFFLSSKPKLQTYCFSHVKVVSLLISELKSMAFCGIGFSYGLEGMDLLSPSVNSSKRLHFFDSQQQQQRLLRRRSPPLPREKQQSRGIRCLASELKESHKHVASEEDCEEDLRHVLKFRMSDFVICNSVSIGLGGRGDELVFEAMVRNVECPLHNKRVVLRKFTSTQAQRRGRRSVQVLKKLARRKLLYHSYSMQVHGYVDPSSGTDQNSFTLVHGYHGSYSLRHWLQLSNWLPTLEATLALDEERVRKVGDDTVGGPAVSRLLRIIRVLMRDLLIGVNYLHSHGLAHTELKLENVHISPLDHHIKVGILGNASDFIDNSPNNGTLENNMDRRQMMIAFDMRCVGFMMAKMVLRELMDPLVFMKFKTFLTKGNDASCLREFLLPILSANSPSGNAGLQILDRNWGAGWNLLSLLLATKTSSKKISCLDALRHPFLCGPRWKVDPSMDLIRWGLGSTAVRITEEYIYGIHQRSRLAHFIELMETLNPFQRPKNWLKLLPGKWRLLYSTGRHLGLTFRQPSERVLINDVHLSVTRANDTNTNLVFTSDVNFKVMIGSNWPHNKMGSMGNLQISSLFRLTAGRRQYLREENNQGTLSNSHGLVSNRPSRKWRTASQIKGPPSSLPVAKLTSGEIDVTMQLYDSSLQEVSVAQNVIREVRTQVPPEMFDVSKLVCGTYVDSRLLVLRGVNGSALLFTRACR